MTEPQDNPRRRAYARPPIVEAAIALRFGATLPLDRLYEALKKGLGDAYPKPRKIESVVIHARVGSDSVDTRTERRSVLRCRESPDGLRLVGGGANVLSVHVLAPYPGWENFRYQLEEGVAALGAGFDDLPVVEVVVHYIDRIELPQESQLVLNEFLTIIPPRPAALPPEASAFSWAIDGLDSKSGTRTRLELGFQCGSEVKPHVIRYDLSALRTLMAPATLGSGTWWQAVDELHLLQRHTFEQSITDRMRVLFE